jgi:hypothetical protein
MSVRAAGSPDVVDGWACALDVVAVLVVAVVVVVLDVVVTVGVAVVVVVVVPRAQAATPSVRTAARRV